MPAPLHIIFRLFMILAGLLAAALAAGVTLMLVEASGLMRPFDVTEGEARDALFVNALIVSGFALVLGFLPAFVAALLAEIFRWRWIVYYGIAGALIGFYLVFEPIPAWINITREGEALVGNAWKAYPAAGIVAGAAYWLVTGCRAGFVRDTINNPDSTQ